GIDSCSIAKSRHRRVHHANGKPFTVSNKILQKVQIETLGGQIERIVDLDTEDLELFLLPSDLKVYPEQEMISGYAERAIVDVDLDHKIVLNDTEILPAKFESFTGELLPFVLVLSNGRPLHLVGDGHRNELVSTINPAEIKGAHFIGDHQMIPATTLTEDGKKNELLISAKEMNSWLTFHEGYLPILKKVLQLQGGKWEYNLFELRESRGEAEYLVVEKKTPYRLLVENKGGKHSPKIVKRGSAELKVPEQISRLKKLFVEDPGYLLTLE
ncbi:hypothetical protein N9B82_04475, partial [Saprospiraceae bacterium]|nr:hypothetical protein [Saprospiraceae bacterium]